MSRYLTERIVMGVVVLYNLGVLSYIEKVKEIATLKVLGVRSGNIRFILLQQNFVITAIGAVLGIPFGIVALEQLIDIFLSGRSCPGCIQNKLSDRLPRSQ